MEYYILAEASGEARGILETLKKNLNFEKKIFEETERKKIECYPQGNHGFPKQMSANLVQQFGQLQLTSI